MLQTERLINALNESPAFLRKSILKLLIKQEKYDKSLTPTIKNRVALNFASSYYYSLYSPSMCAYTAYRLGLKAVGVNDYASLASSKEFKKACKVLNMPYVLGYHAECEPLFNEVKASCYTYGVPFTKIKLIEKELKLIRVEKKEYVEALVKKINSRLKKYSIFVPILEVMASSTYLQGGAVTEKHVAKILAKKIIERFKTGEEIINFLTTVLKINVASEEKDYLTLSNNKYLNEDLTRVIYNNVHVFKAGETLRDASELLSLDEITGAITAYKLRLKNFDKNFILNAISTLKGKNFNAVAFSSDALTETETNEIANLFIENDLLPIVVDRAGMPRQVIDAKPMNETLYNSAKAVIGNAVSSSVSVDDGMFRKNTISKCPSLLKRIEIFKNVTE